MFKPMRRANLQRSESEAYDFLNRAEWGVLSVCDGGIPYGVPMSHAVLGKTIYFHCALEGQKLDFIKANPKGCFTAVSHAVVLRKKGSAEYESVMAYGPLRIVDDPEERLKGFDVINEKFTDGFELGRVFVEKWGADALVLALDIEHLAAKSNRKAE